MKAPLEEEEDGDCEDDAEEEAQILRPVDKYGLDIDGEFRTHKYKRRFTHWPEVAKVAFEVNLDEMKTLLESQP